MFLGDSMRGLIWVRGLIKEVLRGVTLGIRLMMSQTMRSL